MVTDYETGTVLVSEDAETARYPASLTKLMTLYLLFEAVQEGRITLDQALPISAYAASQPPTRLRLKPGSGIKVADCIDALILRSANDVAVVVAEALAGTESQFAARMTRKAAGLGMTNTSFRNASGLPDDGQVTTARDLTILVHALIKRFPEYYPHFALRSSRAAGKNISTHNNFLGAYDGVDGLKTGYTQAAGHNLAASAVRGDHRLIGVVLGESSGGARNHRMTLMMNQAFTALGVPLTRKGKKVAAKTGKRHRHVKIARHRSRSRARAASAE
ncbi:MAG: D-alanyl-D-alanine carboxypeptidase family protein [Bryobacteraceae bacterium]